MKFINASGAMVDLEVQVIHGARKWRADDAYRLLNAQAQPIPTQIVAQLLREAKEHAEEQVKYAWSVHRSGSDSSTDAAYSFTRTAGVMADETYNALYHLYSQLSPSAANIQACNDDKRHESVELERSLLGTKYPLFQQTPIAYNNRAFFAMQAKKYEQAIQLYQKAGKLLNQQGGINSDEHVRYFRGISDCYKALNDIPNAIDYLQKALTLHKRLFPAVSRKTWEDEIHTLVTESKQRVGREGVVTIDTYPGLDDEATDVLVALSTSTTVNGVFCSDITPLHRYGFHGIPATEPSSFQGPPSPAPLD